MTTFTSASSTPLTRERRDHDTASLRNLWRFLAYARPYWKWLVAGLVTGVARMALPLYMPVFLAGIIDYIVLPYTSHEIDRAAADSRLWTVITLFLIAACIHGVATMGRFYFPHVAMASAIRDLRYKLYGHVQRLSLEFHAKRPTGGIVSRIMSDVNVAQQIIDLLMVQASQQLMRAIVIVSMLLYADWRWALVSFSTLPFFVIFTRLLRRHMRSATRHVQESVERISGVVQERMAMIREVQAFTAEDYEEETVLTEVERLRARTLKQRVLAGLVSSVGELTRFGALAIVAGFGAYRVITTADLPNPVTVGLLVLFFQYTRMALQPLEFFADLYEKMHTASVAADRVFDFFDTVPDVRDMPDARPLAVTGSPAVEFDHIRFCYPAESPVVVLNDVSARIEPGWRVALVGGSGAGKSTMMTLLPRFYDVQEGRVLINGQDVRGVTIQSLRAAVGIVPQEPVLFGGTIRENIRYGRRDATEEQMRQAARAANAEQFILDMPDGYDTIIGERGVGLSGGQIQRLAIARAFLKNPAILILDEATSNLDAVSESLVMDAIDRLVEGRTTFMIAHRLSTARHADMILVMSDGRIVERGTHDDLLSLGGVYADLWHRQIEGRAG